MTPDQAAAFVIAQAASAMAEIEAMKISNADHAAVKLAHDCNVEWQPPPYSADDFRAVADRFGLGHNAVLILFESTNR